MNLEIHKRFLRVAESFSPPLKDALASIGPISFPDRRRPGLPYFLSRAIVGQQLSTKAARSIWLRIEDAAKKSGTRIPGFFMPRNNSKLANCGVSRNKIRALNSIRDAYDQGILSHGRLSKMQSFERSEHLQSIWGIGPWTADMASIFYYQDPDVWPEGDMAVQKAFARFTDGVFTAIDVANLFSPHRSYLALYMWRIVDGGL